jgi:ABC-type Fe3+-hydroxamate transport system substrate-binding protein
MDEFGCKKVQRRSNLRPLRLKKHWMEYTDQMGRRVSLQNWPPRRIVSLVPSQTELLADWGLGDAVVGITKFCVRPSEWYSSKKRVGGTKTVDLGKVAALRPDLIVGNKEENVQEQIEALAQKFPVWMSDIAVLDDALDMMCSLGQVVGKAAEAEAMAAQVAAQFSQLPKPAARPRAAYLIWRKPYMVAASSTFIDDMLHWAGFENAFAHLTRYPELSLAELAAAQPDCLLLSSEPFPFAEKHIPPLQELCPQARIQIVDGECFSWYGSRLLHSAVYFREIHAQNWVLSQGN